ncbi:hypothetical protein DH2020_029232 [Rehmannia glutinosa]|uniref:Uncharacterized protein n=1 Tax=Rehmannia glutinosa TaxID=99300 RepID=A0ABR0VRS8_REHGL
MATYDTQPNGDQHMVAPFIQDINKDQNNFYHIPPQISPVINNSPVVSLVDIDNTVTETINSDPITADIAPLQSENIISDTLLTPEDQQE